METFGQMLKRFRERKGYDKKGLAEAIRVDRGRIAVWENGTSRPRSRAVLHDLSEKLGLSAQETAAFGDAYQAWGVSSDAPTRSADTSAPSPAATPSGPTITATVNVGQVTDGQASITGVAIDAVQGNVTIQQTFTALLRPTPPPFRAAVRRMIEDYEAVFGGRDAELAALDAFLAQDAESFALLLAPTGRGKTALLIHWIARVQRQSGWHVIFVPISLRYQTASAEMALGALATALAEYHHEGDKLQTYNTSPDFLRPIIADYLRRPAPDDRRLLLILDGLDEATGWTVGRDLFPRTPEPHLRMVASARQLAHTTRANWLHILGWQATCTVDVSLGNLHRAAVSDILRQMGNPLDTLATDVDFLTDIGRISQGDPLTIRFLIEALQGGELLPRKLTHMTAGLGAYIDDWLAELREQSTQADTIYDLLTLCAVALGPLTSDDLQTLSPQHFARLARLQATVSQVRRFVIGDGSLERGYVFSHPRLRELFVEKVLSKQERAAAQQRLIAYGQAWYDQYRRQRDQTDQPPAYLRQFWVSHLALAGQWDTARQVLTEVIPAGERWIQPWAAARFSAEGSYIGYLGDLGRLWSHSEESGDLLSGVRCALIASSIRSLSGNITPELLVGLVTVGTPEGKWSPAAALEHIRQIPDPSRRHERGALNIM